MMRGDPKLVICPKVPLVMLLVGAFQLAWFMTLNTSARTCIVQRSFIWKLRLSAMSQLMLPGATSASRPEFPKVPKGCLANAA